MCHREKFGSVFWVEIDGDFLTRGQQPKAGDTFGAATKEKYVKHLHLKDLMFICEELKATFTMHFNKPFIDLKEQKNSP